MSEKSAIKLAGIAETRLARYRRDRLAYIATLDARVRRILLADGWVTDEDEQALREANENSEGAESGPPGY